MENSFQIFRTFSTLEAAIRLQNLLSNYNIKSESGDNIPSADITFVNSKVHHQYEVRIAKEDFGEAENLLLKDINLDSIDESHYLFQFTNDELYDILAKPDEWSTLDYKLTQHLLTKRGETINEKLLASLKNKRLKNLSQPETNQQLWIVTGYILAFLGGFLGLLIGYILRTSKKTLPNGEKIYAYSKSDRLHGFYIFGIGLISTPIYFYYKFMLEM